jgi:membrane protease YdiL (CAAX protease family)
MDPQPAPPAPSWRSVARDELRAWLVAVAMLACTLLLGGILLAGASTWMPAVGEAAADAAMPAGVFLVRALATEIGLLVPAALVLAFGAGRSVWSIAGKDLGACVGAVVAMLAINGAGSWLMSAIGEPYLGFPSLDGEPWVLAAAFGCAVVLAPVTEELFFREALLCRVFARSARPYALAVTALLFGGLHASSGGPVLLASLSILGVILGWVRWRTGSIGAAIVVHAVHNALAWIFVAGR